VVWTRMPGPPDGTNDLKNSTSVRPHWAVMALPFTG